MKLSYFSFSTLQIRGNNSYFLRVCIVSIAVLFKLHIYFLFFITFLQSSCCYVDFANEEIEIHRVQAIFPGHVGSKPLSWNQYSGLFDLTLRPALNALLTQIILRLFCSFLILLIKCTGVALVNVII